MEMKISEVNVQPSEKINKKTRIYFFIKDENIMENLVNRHNRPHNEYRKLLPQVLEQAGIEQQKGNWSQYAGCSCPCSPGFILQENKGLEIFVTI